MTAQGEGLVVCGVAKRFGGSAALAGADLQVGEGELLALLGPSGSGKTTLLRVLAGLEQPDAGEVRFQGADLLAQSARDRRIGMVFQHYALFRHMTVASNIAFGLDSRPRRERIGRKAVNARVDELLRLVKLEDYGPRRPAQLSGGQRQRVALARALAIEPRMLLLDEPFGALDAQVRAELRRWLREVHRRAGVTTILVTHDQEEALETADRIAVMNGGRVVQVGTPEQVYSAPVNSFVFAFLGGVVRLPARLDGQRAWFGDYAAPCAGPVGDAIAHVRPEALEIAAVGEGLAATLRTLRKVGPRVQVELSLPDGGIVEAVLTTDAAESLARGPVHIRPRSFCIYPEARRQES